jgi:hypothetical protein
MTHVMLFLNKMCINNNEKRGNIGNCYDVGILGVK